MPILADLVQVVIGVDTHKHTHTAAVLAAASGGMLATQTVPTTPAGYQALLTLAQQHPGPGCGRWRAPAATAPGLPGCWPPRRVGGGAGPAQAGQPAAMVPSPTRWMRSAPPARRWAVTSLPSLAPAGSGPPWGCCWRPAAQRWHASTCAQGQLQAMVVAAPERLRTRLRGHSTRQLIAACARLRGHPSWEVECRTTAVVLQRLARRVLELDAEARTHQQAILRIARGWRPDLLAELGVGPIVAATVLGAWSHPGRCRSEAAFAMLGGAAPIPASSGQTVRHRLNRSGDRQLNRALHTIVLTRLRRDPATRPTPSDDGPRARPTGRSSGASSATSPASSTGSSKPNQPLTQHRWHVSGTPSARCGTLAASDRNGGSQRRSRWPS